MAAWVGHGRGQSGRRLYAIGAEKPGAEVEVSGADVPGDEEGRSGPWTPVHRFAVRPGGVR
ncbi:hypothetical protein, partial [Crossiella equi]|uniref:hypothetical protein n=1 Tax=Crossiella equi TaxID=130796 RepID=UPI001178464E